MKKVVLCARPDLCEIASKRDPTQEGASVVDYTKNSTSSAGSRFAQKVTPAHSELS